MTAAAAVLADDPAVRHRDTLIDPDQMRPRLSAHLRGTTIHSIETMRVKYRVGDSLRVVYRLKTDGDDVVVTARTFESPPHHAPDLVRVTPSPSRTRLRSAFSDPQLDARFWIFPDDRRLAHVRAALTPPRGLAARLDRAWSSSRLVAYAPEKSAVVACLDRADEIFAYAKVFHSSDEARRAFELQRAMCALADRSPRMRIPGVLAFDASHSVLVTAAAPGKRLTDLEPAEAPAAAAMLGEAIAHLHGLDIPLEALPLRRATPHTLRFAAAVIGRMQPMLHDDVSRLAEDLIAGAPPERNAVVLHGDVHLKNALLDNGQLWLIDLDQVACGPAAAELGSFLALLASRVAADLMAADDAAVLRTRFLEGYAAVRPLPPRPELDWHTAAALVDERALRALSRLRMPIIRNLPRLLGEARRLLQGASR